MVDPNTRQGKRTPVTLKIKFKSETLEQFIERYAVDVSQGGIFIRTKEPLAVGTQMRFEFQLRDASPLIGGEGTVVWTRENDPSRPAIAPGMGVRFDRLAEGSQGVLERILSEKAKQAPHRPNTEPTKPPMFSDTPTRVAPLPVQDALLGNERNRSDAFSDQGTPLPRPMPFHSDADEFPEEAFEEQTKVRALDELIAQTAGSEQAAAAEDLARSRRSDATIADPPRTSSLAEATRPAIADRDSAPTLPSPPAPEARTPKVLDTTPSPRAETAAPAAVVAASAPPPAADPAPARTKLGLEAPKAAAKPASAPVVAKDAVTKPTGMRAAATESAGKSKHPAAPAPKSSAAPLIVFLLLLVAGGAAAVWFFVLRDKAVDSVASHTGSGAQLGSAGSAGSAGSGDVVALGGGTTGSGDPTGSGTTAGSGDTAGTGSAGSADVMTGSGTTAGSGDTASSGSGSATAMTGGEGSAAPPTPSALVDAVIGSNAPRATVEVIGTTFRGNAPLRAKLERDKLYRARVQAPGFVAQELSIKGGETRPFARLVAKPRAITITSEPGGALIFIENANSGFTTPHTFELSEGQIAKKSVRVTLRKNGFKTVERMIGLANYVDDGSKMTAKVDEKLPVQGAIPAPTTGSGTPDTGAGSSTPPGPGPSGDGPKDGPKPTEPEPDFLNRE